MRHFFVSPSQIEGNKIMITGSDVRHIASVLRMSPGEEISVSDGITPREYRCIIEEVSDSAITCRLIFIKEENIELSSNVYLFQGLPKADKMELIIQKAVELGVYEIIPVASERAVVKLNEKREQTKIARWRGIAEAAAKQSKRQVVPVIREVMSFQEAADYAAMMDVKIIPYEMAEGMSETKKIINTLTEGQRIAVFIGPEGGFTEQEIRMAAKAHIMPVTMGKRILRTETAGLIMLGWIMYQLEK